MSVNTVLLDFSIEPNQIADDLSRKDVLKKIRDHLSKYFPQLSFIYDMITDDGYLCILKEAAGVIITIRFFHQGLITINVEYYRAENEPSKLSFDVSTFFSIYFTSLSLLIILLNEKVAKINICVIKTIHHSIFSLYNNYFCEAHTKIQRKVLIFISRPRIFLFFSPYLCLHMYGVYFISV